MPSFASSKSKDQQEATSTDMHVPRIIITAPSSLTHVDGYSAPKPENNGLHFISFLACSHNGFYSTSAAAQTDAFVSTLRPIAPDASIPVAVEEMYTFNKPCPRCNPRARVLNEPPESSFVKALKEAERWSVYRPMVEAAIPNSIRRFGKFEFEVDRIQETEGAGMVGGRNRTASGQWQKIEETKPVYIEDMGSKEKRERKRRRA